MPVPDPAAEQVALYDATGRVIGTADRGRVYREGLWHAGTGVLVRSGDGRRVHLHRRTPTKLVYADRYDCWAGGVVDPGETPVECARRELAEELGVAGAPLTPLGAYPYEHTDDGPGAAVVRFHGFLYEVRWDGPLHLQSSEISWAAWVTVDRLRTVLADPLRWPFVPDGRRAVARWLAGELATSPPG